MNSSRDVIAAISSGSLSAANYIRALTARSKSHNITSLNAMICWDEDSALAAAKAIDEEKLAQHPISFDAILHRPLAGLPIVVKDNINTNNFKTTGGTPALKDLQPSRNAPSLQKLINAGIIIFVIE
jgi:mandelamide amidase